MICPRCGNAVLTGTPDEWRRCPSCGLNRRPDDKILIRADTQFRILKRNISRTPPGTQVVVETCGEVLAGIFGVFEGSEPTYVLKPVHVGRCIAFSKDLEDIVLLAVEHQWWFDGPEEIVNLAATLLE